MAPLWPLRLEMLRRREATQAPRRSSSRSSTSVRLRRRLAVSHLAALQGQQTKFCKSLVSLGTALAAHTRQDGDDEFDIAFDRLQAGLCYMQMRPVRGADKKVSFAELEPWPPSDDVRDRACSRPHVIRIKKQGCVVPGTLWLPAAPSHRPRVVHL